MEPKEPTLEEAKAVYRLDQLRVQLRQLLEDKAIYSPLGMRLRADKLLLEYIGDKKVAELYEEVIYGPDRRNRS